MNERRFPNPEAPGSRPGSPANIGVALEQARADCHQMLHLGMQPVTAGKGKVLRCSR